MRFMKVIVSVLVLLFMPFSLAYSAVKSISSIPTPVGFERTEASNNSYKNYLRALPLKENKIVELWNGSVMPEDSYESLAVLDVPLLFNEDLEQCADFSMRFWASYLESIDNLNELALYDFYGNKKPFLSSGKSVKEYLYWHMKYSNSYSIKLGANRVYSLEQLTAGDMFVQNESEEGIGHVSVVVDEAINAFGHKVYLVGYSYMPAQQFHIEKAPESFGLQGWFTAKGYTEYAEATFGAFGKPVVMRFAEDR